MKLLFVWWFSFVLRNGVLAQDPETTPLTPTLTSFTCHGRSPGYYADLETGCRTYHVCDGHSQFTYVCPKRTLFQQKSRICDHSYLVRCEDSPSFFEAENIREELEKDIFTLLTGERSRISGRGNEAINQTQQFTSAIVEITVTPVTATTKAPPPPSATTTPVKSTTLAASTVPVSKENNEVIRKFLKFRVKDFRSLFFIPEFESNSIVAKPEKELILPVEKNDVMSFRTRKNGARSFNPCPSYCNPKFFVPTTCHPCIMIK